MKSNYYSDSDFERNSIEYLKAHNVLEKLGFTDIIHIEDKETQIKGVDVIANLGEQKVTIDVKSVASMLPTFSQEIANCASKRIGWIMNNKLETDYYLYVWHNVSGIPYSEAKNKIALDCECITNSDCVLVKKSVLQDFIFQNFGTVCSEEVGEKFIRVTSKIPNQNSTVYFILNENRKLCWGLEKPSGHGVYITRSDKIKEQPLNFIIRKSDLEKMGKLIRV